MYIESRLRSFVSAATPSTERKYAHVGRESCVEGIPPRNDHLILTTGQGQQLARFSLRALREARTLISPLPSVSL